ncbi:amino acid ABC transporter substrate-binding protein [Clavibacter zhangzhiyongii]|uniref:amino acid ABC transporter substrate-binding protein n=1 Tax=Clavibacter zhangzhiyongii TaxID=2768071 RepID=UPI001957820F|nr:amino acid ABC transporter substrate-binding protein [Clavibacter zhangzhiyongii]MBM7024353.1 amino acid ABC transporter substrate-binding protein [Clavibacter zhangzhiyongii]
MSLLSRIRPSLALTGLVAVAALGLAGCASGDAGSGSATDPSASPAAASSLADVQAAGKLVIGTEGTYSPFSFHEGSGSGALTGYDVDIATAVAEKLGVEPVFEETQFDGIFAGLEAGRWDVIANQISVNDDREAVYDFSEPYTVSPGVIIVKGSDSGISSFDDLAGKTTAQSLTSNWNELATESGAKVEAVEGFAQAVTLLQQGRVDATINDRLTLLDYQKQQGDSDLQVAAETDDPSLCAFAFRKGSDDLVTAVDDALAELRADGTLATISEKYFGEDVSQ